MAFLKAILLGVLQGITEFLPVSSSGHLRLLEKGLGLSHPEPLFEIVLHIGTLLAIFGVYWDELGDLLRSCLRWARGRNLTWKDKASVRFALYVLVATVPTGILGYYLRGVFQRMGLSYVALMFLVTATLLFLTRGTPGDTRGEPIGLRRSLVVGIMQGLAVLPGVSRSGSTISVGLVLGIPRAEAARFSFFLAIPATIGALALGIGEFSSKTSFGLGQMLVGAFVAAIVGYLSLRFLLGVVERGRLWVFSLYLIPIAVITFLLSR